MQRQRWQLLALYAVVLVALAWPVLWVEVPVGVDTLYHVARVYVRANVGTDPDLARLFEVRRILTPYLGMDALLTPLVPLMPPLLLARGFTVLLVWGVVGATAVLHRSFNGRWGWEPLLASLVAWQGLTAWAFLNYILGAILAMLAYAVWRAAREWPPVWRLLAFTIVSTGLYLTHVLALGAYGLLVAVDSLTGPAQYRRPRYLLVTVLPFVPSFALLAAITIDQAPAIHASPFYDYQFKMLALLSPFLFSGFAGGRDPGYIVAAVCALACVIGAVRGVLRLAPDAKWQSIVLFGLIVALPISAGGLFGADIRLPIVASCVLIAGLQIQIVSPLVLATLAIAGAGLLAVRVADVSATMQTYQPAYAEIRSTLAQVPRGTLIIPVINRTKTQGVPLSNSLYEHMALMVTLDRSGISTDFYGQLSAVQGLGIAAGPISPDIGRPLPPGVPTGTYALVFHLGDPWTIPPGARRITQGAIVDLAVLP